MLKKFSAIFQRRGNTADRLSCNAFLAEAARSRRIRTGPENLTSYELNALEYVGLLMPVAKLITPAQYALDGTINPRYDPKGSEAPWMDGPCATFSVDGESWVFWAVTTSDGTPIEPGQSITGEIVFPTAVEYWQALRGVRPAHLTVWKQHRPAWYAAYTEQPFDVPPELIRYGNVELPLGAPIPVYARDEVKKFVDLVEWFSQPLRLASAILLTAEAQKRAAKRNEARELRDNTWGTLIDDYESLLCSSGYSRQKPPPIETHFYRNHFITCYVESRRRQGTSILAACGEVATEITQRSPTGDEPFSPETARRIYYRTCKSPVLA